MPKNVIVSCQLLKETETTTLAKMLQEIEKETLKHESRGCLPVAGIFAVPCTIRASPNPAQEFLILIPSGSQLVTAWPIACADGEAAHCVLASFFWYDVASQQPKVWGCPEEQTKPRLAQQVHVYREDTFLETGTRTQPNLAPCGAMLLALPVSGLIFRLRVRFPFAPKVCYTLRLRDR